MDIGPFPPSTPLPPSYLHSPPLELFILAAGLADKQHPPAFPFSFFLLVVVTIKDCDAVLSKFRSIVSDFLTSCRLAVIVSSYKNLFSPYTSLLKWYPITPRLLHLRNFIHSIAYTIALSIGQSLNSTHIDLIPTA